MIKQHVLGTQGRRLCQDCGGALLSCCAIVLKVYADDL